MDSTMDLLRYVGNVECRDAKLDVGFKDVFSPSKVGEYVTDSVYKSTQTQVPNLIEAVQYLHSLPNTTTKS